MIRWSMMPTPWYPSFQNRWRRDICAHTWKRGEDTCIGVGRTWNDDEPHDVCKVCDKLALNKEES